MMLSMQKILHCSLPLKQKFMQKRTGVMNVHDDVQPDWKAFQDHVTHLFWDRLATWPGQVIWKAYTPQHFGGPFGMDSM